MAVLKLPVALLLYSASREARSNADRDHAGSQSADLKQREYRDEKGEVHHHTHTYMEQHRGESKTGEHKAGEHKASDGEMLQDRLEREGRLPIAEILRFSREMAEGLAAAHEQALIHRDIKPGNIWLERAPGRSAKRASFFR